MKFGVRVLIALCTFILGVVVSAVTHVIPWRSSSSPVVTSRYVVSETSSFGTGCRSRVPSVSICDLIRDSDRYDGRIVRIEGVFHRGKDTASLADDSCGAWVDPSCTFNEEACTRIWGRVLEGRDSFPVKLDVVGRYQVKEANDGRSVNAFEILELKEVTPVADASDDTHKAP
jgi:hypothetical protein